jgi:hypothetical protein
MATATELEEYLAEIRREVCSHCVEKPPGGPPCAPLGKVCGIELHLPQLIESIHKVHSPFIGPYLDHNRAEVCSKCAFLHSSVCPCPMDYLAVLLAEAVETVDARRPRPDDLRQLAEQPGEGATVAEAYEAASGRWSGCDWPTEFGLTGLNLENETPQAARARAEELAGSPAGKDWAAASQWLGCVERYAAQAEARAAAAIKAAAAGEWGEALDNAEWAWSLEFITGRPFRRAGPLTWQAFRDAMKKGYLAHTARKPLNW